MSFFISDAWAQTAGDAGGSSLLSLLPMVAIFAIFYFILIRPQQKRAKQHKAMVADLAKGDEVITNGGLFGRVVDAEDDVLHVEIANNVTVQIQRFAVAQQLPKGAMKAPK